MMVETSNKKYVVTTLFASDKNKKKHPTTKTIGVKSDNSHNYLFDYVATEVDSIESLSAHLLALRGNPYAAIIRGEIVPNQKKHKGIARSKDDSTKGYVGNFRSHELGLPFLMLDFDDIDKLGLIDSSNLLQDPVSVVEQAIKLLPECFHNCDYHYQMSANSGVKSDNMFRAHLWFWLKEPVHDDKLRYWAKEIVNKTYPLIDEHMFDAIQLHYTANPIIPVGTSDPFPENRDGFIKKASSEVTLPAFEVLKHTPIQVDSDTTKFSHSSKGLAWLEEEIGDHVGGKGFRKAIYAYICSYVHTYGIDCDLDTCKETVRSIVAASDQSKHELGDIAKKTSDVVLDREFKRAVEFVAKSKSASTTKKGKISGIPPHYAKYSFLSAQDASGELLQAIFDWVMHPSDIGIEGSAGLGKTSVVARCICKLWMKGLKGEIYVPSYKIAVSYKKLLEKFHPDLKVRTPYPAGNISNPINVQIIYGRSHKKFVDSEGNSSQCPRYKDIDEFIARNQAVFPHMCKSGDISCGFFGSCGYTTQYQGSWDVRIYVQQNIGKSRSLLDNPKPDYAIIDEAFFKEIISGYEQRILIPVSKFTKCNWNENLIAALQSAPEGDGILAYLKNAIHTPTLQTYISEAITTQEKEEKTNKISLIHLNDASFAAGSLPEKNHYLDLLNTLLTELSTGRNSSHGITVQDGKFVLCYRKNITRLRGVPTLVIDADLAEGIYKQSFPAGVIKTIEAQRKVKVFQSYSTKQATSTLSKMGGSKDIALAQKLIDRVSKESNAAGELKRVLIIGPQSIVGNFDKSDKPSRLVVPKNAKVIHYGSYRGVDEYKNFDVCIVIGRNQPPFEEMERMARALWFDSVEPLKLGKEFRTEVQRGITSTCCMEVGVMVSVHLDPRVQMVMEQCRESETLQGIDRLRLIWSTEGKDVYILSNLPLDLPIDHFLTLDELASGTTKLTEAFKKMKGVLPLSPTWLSDHMPELFSLQGVKKYMQSFERQKPKLLNALWGVDPKTVKVFSYKLVGKTTPPSLCLSTVSVAETRQLLKSLVQHDNISLEEVM